MLFMLLVAMNGFSESDATPGLLTYVGLTILASGAMAAAAFFLTGAFVRREFKSLTAALIAVPICSIVASGLIFVSTIIGVAVAEFVRVRYR